MERSRRVWVGWALASVIASACSRAPGGEPTRKMEMRLVSESGSDAERVDTWSGEAPLALERTVIVSGRDVQKVELLAEPGSDRHFISVQLDSNAGQRFEQVTAANVGRRLAIVVGDRVAVAPVIRDKIAGGRMSITAGSEADLEQMRLLLGG